MSARLGFCALLTMTACCGGGHSGRPASGPPVYEYTYAPVYGAPANGAPGATPAPPAAATAPETAPAPSAEAPNAAPHVREPNQVGRSDLHVVPPAAPASSGPTTPGVVVPAARPSAPSTAATPVVVVPPATPTVVAPRVVTPRVEEPVVAPPRQPAQPVVHAPSAIPVRPAPTVQNPAPVVAPAPHVTRNDPPKVVRATVPGAAPTAPDPKVGRPVVRNTNGKPRTPAHRVDPRVHPVGQVPLRPVPVHPVPVRPVPTDAPAVRTGQ